MSTLTTPGRVRRATVSVLAAAGVTVTLLAGAAPALAIVSQSSTIVTSSQQTIDLGATVDLSATVDGSLPTAPQPAGTIGAPGSITATVNAPPDYVLHSDLFSGFGGTGAQTMLVKTRVTKQAIDAQLIPVQIDSLGIPTLAHGGMAATILSRVRSLSANLGTRVKIANGKGYVHVTR